jgi:hypothetical protein
MTLMRKSCILVAASFIALSAASRAQTAATTAEACSLLSPANVAKAVGHSYDAPLLMGDPRTFDNPKGDTDCNYIPRSVGEPLMLRVFVDQSPEQSTELFDKLKAFHGQVTTISGIGDEAYLDSRHAMRVRKGNVRYYLELSEDAKADKPVMELAAEVAARL